MSDEIMDQLLGTTEASKSASAEAERSVRLRSLERIRVYREDGSSYSVSYADVDTIELSHDSTELSLLLRGGVQWHLVGQALHHLASLLDMHAIASLAVHDPDVPREGRHAHYTITRIHIIESMRKSVVNIPKRV